LTRTLLHLTLAQTVMWEGPGSKSRRERVDVRTWAAERRVAGEVSGPLKMTKLPLGVHLTAETLTLAKVGWVVSASEHNIMTKSACICNWTARLVEQGASGREMTRLAWGGGTGLGGGGGAAMA